MLFTDSPRIGKKLVLEVDIVAGNGPTQRHAFHGFCVHTRHERDSSWDIVSSSHPCARTYDTGVFDRVPITQLLGSERLGARDGRQRDVAGVRFECGVDVETTQHQAVRLTRQTVRARAWYAWHGRRPSIAIRSM